MSQRAFLSATYRLQFNPGFTLHHARELVPYLARLGISHLYASPILAARPGSTHGYDVVDPRVVNPELGGEPALRALSAALREHGMGLVLDIVPNHMGTGAANPFWDDVLMHGPASRHASWFDIDWPAPPARGRVLLPVLGDELDDVLARDEMRVVHDAGRFRVAYYENSFPLDPATVHRLLSFTHRHDSPPDDAEASAEASTDALGAFAAGDDGRERLRALLDLQHYSLAYWRRAASELDYRRFFDVNDLAALRADAPGVFDDTHARVLEMVGDGTVDALRVDHVDGLADPLGYLLRLRAELERRRPQERVPIFVEKILSAGESLRGDWPVDGTTGYEFANDLEALFIDAAGAASIERGYQKLVGGDAARGFHDAALRGKAFILRTALAADVKRLARELRAAAPQLAAEHGVRRAQLTRALEELIVALPVYRTYVDTRPAGGAGTREAGTGALRVSDDDRRLIEQALEQALARGIAEAAALRAVASVLLGGSADAWPFVARFQQTSGPATAKGVEDTALYRYVPLVSRNEVGGEAGAPLDDAAARLHEANAGRARAWPRHLLSVTTHDTKRSADLRARVDVLSEIPDAWLAHVSRWRRRHGSLRVRVGARHAPDANAEYLLYQTLLGIWPLGDSSGAPPDPLALDQLAERVDAYMLKAAREAKVHTSWTDPRPDAERALSGFVRALVRGEPGAEFRDELTALVKRIGPAGLWNAVGRALVHLTAPGTPDVYQGDELWNLALVDPDNRRAVDYAIRARLLDELGAARDPAERETLVRQLAASPADGAIKLFVIAAALAERRARPALFAHGDYLPLAASGPRAGELFAFARTHEGAACITVVPRLTLPLVSSGTLFGDENAWAETLLSLPPTLAGTPLASALTTRAVGGTSGEPLRVDELFRSCPAALLVGTRP